MLLLFTISRAKSCHRIPIQHEPNSSSECKNFLVMWQGTQSRFLCWMACAVIISLEKGHCAFFFRPSATKSGQESCHCRCHAGPARGDS